MTGRKLQGTMDKGQEQSGRKGRGNLLASRHLKLELFMQARLRTTNEDTGHFLISKGIGTFHEYRPANISRTPRAVLPAL